MSLFVLLLQAAVLYVVTLFLWRLFRHFLVKSPLDKVPGPPSASYVTGKRVCPPRQILMYRCLTRVQGNIEQVFANDGWDFQRELMSYGPVVKFHGLLGVSPSDLR